MRANDELRLIKAVEAGPDMMLSVIWAEADPALIDFRLIAEAPAYAPLQKKDLFAQAAVGDWGHSVIWPGDIEIGADALWLEALSSWGRDDTRAFIEWRLRHALTLNGAAEALGLSRAQAARYSNGAPVPRSIQLACRGWEALRAA